MRLMSRIAALCLAVSPAVAQDSNEITVGIAKDMPTVTIETADGPVTIQRPQDSDHVVTGEWARTSRPCPPFCIQPMAPAEGVTTIGELELLDMLKDPETLVLDSRLAKWRARGTIPGSVHMPYDKVVDRLDELGCLPDFDGWDCSGAKRVALFCNGLWCGQSPSAIRNMIAEGYPPEKIFYYRGGMQSWNVLGLTVVVPGE